MKKCLLSVMMLWEGIFLYGQNNWVYKGNFNFGCNVMLNYRKDQQFPGLKVFAAFYANASYKKHFVLSYGPSISIYTKSLGANLNPLIGDIQMDLGQSFSIGYGWSNVSYMKYFKTINTGSFYNIATDKKYALFLTSNFIFNNHKRNQVVGSVTVSTPSVTINYYNDGAAPFDKLPLADNFDRYWTGGFGIYIHNKKNYNSVELSFDQFTGYSPLVYEISNLIGINIPSYQLPDSSVGNVHSKIPPDFNTSAYNIKVYTSQGYAIDGGIIGSLRTTNGNVFGLQDIIHTLGKYPLHPNNDINRFYIGGTYNNFQDVRF